MNLIKDFFDYVKKHPVLWFGVFILCYLEHGVMLLSDSIGVDTEAFMAGTGQNWLVIGRQGIVLIKHLLGNNHYNMYYAGVFTMIFLTLACMLWTYYYQSAVGKDNMLASLGFSGIIMSSSIITTHLYFKLQMLEVTFSLCLLAVNLIFLMYVIENEIRYLWLLAIFPQIVLFSVYQVHSVLFVFGIASYVFIKNLFLGEESEIWGTKKGWFNVLKTVIVFVMAMLLNQIISLKWFLVGKNYLTNQILWLSMDKKTLALQIIHSIISTIIGSEPQYTAALGLFFIIVLVPFVWLLKKGKDIHTKIITALALLAVYLSPFALDLILGGVGIRTMLAKPFVCAFLCVVLLLYFEEQVLATAVIVCITAISVISQTYYTQRLNYTEDLRYQQDVALMYQIEERISEIEIENEQEYKLAFYGSRPFKGDANCLNSDLIGVSMFDWDTYAEPIYSRSTYRIVGFFNAHGGTYEAASDEYFESGEIEDAVSEMDVFPAKNSIQTVDDIIVVKLSEQE